jgi:hypothetical protein
MKVARAAAWARRREKLLGSFIETPFLCDDMQRSILEQTRAGANPPWAETSMQASNRASGALSKTINKKPTDLEQAVGSSCDGGERIRASGL